MEKKYKKEYSNREQSMGAIWNVLRKFSSEEHPLTVSEIHSILEKTEDPLPCKSTVDNRLKNALTHGGAGGTLSFMEWQEAGEPERD